jgi:RimJ/RimL family protein N-acetyltransferase
LSDFRTSYEEDLRYPGQFRRVFAMESLENGEHIGNVMYYNIDEQRGEAELGITIGDRRYWSTGYGRDAVRTFVRYLFETTRLRRIYLNTLDWNLRAQRSFKAAGFVSYGVNHRGLHTFISMEIRRDWLEQSGETAAQDNSRPAS